MNMKTVDLPITKITSLIGKPAIEFGPIKAWKNGPPVKLADLKGKAVIISFDGATPNTSRDLPRLVDLHNQFADKGLVIIALYNCPDMEYLDNKWVEIFERFGGVTDVPFRVAIDGGKPTFYEGTDKERLGATYGIYDITSIPTTILDLTPDYVPPLIRDLSTFFILQSGRRSVAEPGGLRLAAKAAGVI